MKQDKCRNAPRRLGNKGFSLIELMISIAVLVIIMVPLMNNFFRSMQMNKKAEKLQVQSNLAASIMEGLKATDIAEIINQFNGIEENFTLISEPAEDVLRLEYNEHMELEESTSHDKQATYYFAIHGIRVGSSAYDAFIMIDSNEYKDITGTMNKYPMPEPINLDEKANALVFSHGSSDGAELTPSMDTLALNSFTLWGTAYAQMKLEQTAEYLAYLNSYSIWQDECEQAAMNGTAPPPEPERPTLESYAVTHPEYGDYFKPELIAKHITKTMRLTVNDKSVIYDIEYFCNWPKGNSLQGITENKVQSSIVDRISVKNYPNPVQNVYLFYTPSAFQSDHPADKVCIINEVSANPVNLFAANQGAGVIPYPVKLQRNGDNLSAYTDIPSYISYVGESQEPGPGTVNNNVVKTKEEDRIFNVEIKICKYEDVAVKDRYRKMEYTLQSTMEE